MQVLRCGELDWPSGRESLYTRDRRVHAGAHASPDGVEARAGSRIARARTFITDPDDAWNTPVEPFFEIARAAGAEVAVHDPRVDPETSPELLRGCSRARMRR